MKFKKIILLASLVIFVFSGSVIAKDISGNYTAESITPERFGPNTTPGTTDMNAEIQAAIDLGKLTGEPVILKAEEYLITGLTLYEGSQLFGQLGAIPATGLGTILTYAGSGKAITCDGAVTGFDSRRFVHLKDFSINVTGSATHSIWFDYVTHFALEGIYCAGGADYHLYGLNTFNGTVRDCHFREATTANSYWTVDIADSVFTGQVLFENTDFWDSPAGHGMVVENTANVMAQMVYSKCHFKTNGGVGFKTDNWTQNVTMTGCHYEANEINDVLSDGLVNPTIIGGFFNNNAMPVGSACVEFSGVGGAVRNCSFVQLSDGYHCISLLGGLTVVEQIKIAQAAGVTLRGVNVVGDNNSIKDLYATRGGGLGPVDVITINAGARGTQIQNISKDGTTVSGAMVIDNGGKAFIFTDADVTAGTDSIAEVGHGFNTMGIVQLTTTGVLPAGLALSTDYYIIKTDDDNIKLASSLANARAGTAVDITAAAGGGNHTLTGNATNTAFVDAVMISSRLLDLDKGSNDTDSVYIGRGGYLNRAWAHYPSGTGASAAAAVQVGRSLSAGTSDYTAYLNTTSPVSAATFYRSAETLAASFINDDSVMLFKTDGLAANPGDVIVTIEITPYRAIN